MPRLREIRYPVLSGIPVGLSVGMTLAVVLTTIILSVGLRRGEEFPTASMMGLLIFTSFFWILTFIQIHKLHHDPPGRMKRLNRLLSADTGRLRFPHRHLERHHRRFLRLTQYGGVRHALKHVENVMILANRRSVSCPLPRGATDGFEPIPLYGDNRRLADLKLLEHQPHAPAFDAADESDYRPATASNSAFPPLHDLARVFTAPFRSVKYIILLGIVFLFTLPALQADPAFAMTFLAIMAATCFVLYRVEGHEYDWWLIPGGMAFRRSGLFFGNSHVRRITARDSTLFFDYDSRLRFVYVAHGHRLYRIACDTTLFPYLLAAWQDGARTPTEDELRDLFTGEA